MKGSDEQVHASAVETVWLLRSVWKDLNCVKWQFLLSYKLVEKARGKHFPKLYSKVYQYFPEKFKYIDIYSFIRLEPKKKKDITEPVSIVPVYVQSFL